MMAPVPPPMSHTLVTPEKSYASTTSSPWRREPSVIAPLNAAPASASTSFTYSKNS